MSRIISIDYYKANGYQAEEEKSMEPAAQAVLAYVNSQIGKSEYNGHWRFERHSRLLSRMRTKILGKGGCSSVTLKDGYSYYVSCASLEETYRTDLFNQGKTALVAGVLASDEAKSEICCYVRAKEPEKWPNDDGVCVIEGTINGKKCMVAMFREASTETSHGLDKDIRKWG